MAAEVKHYKLVFFVPESHKEQLKTLLFEQGAGQYQDYDSCAWETLGQGQFRPLPGSDPFLGQTNMIERVAEFRVEMLCQCQHIKAILQTLIAYHPYEVPAYEVWPIQTLDDF
tara:strand:- start:28 stop:366 length:339 start_codon:yes stop_codon:yes gene_type:complete